MNWLQKIGTLVVPISYAGGVLHVAIDGLHFWYYATDRDKYIVELLCKRRQYDKAKEHLEKLDLAEGPEGFK